MRPGVAGDAGPRRSAYDNAGQLLTGTDGRGRS
jgi:hypothetical protein